MHATINSAITKRHLKVVSQNNITNQIKVKQLFDGRRMAVFYISNTFFLNFNIIVHFYGMAYIRDGLHQPIIFFVSYDT